MNDLGRAYLSGGHVYCPLRHADVDIVEWFGCDRLEELNRRSSPPYIVCDASKRAELGHVDPLHLSWRYQHHRRARPL